MIKHLIDEFDIFVFKELFEAYKENGDLNNWEISKKYAKIINEKDPNKVYRKLKARTKKYCEDGYFKIVINGEEINYSEIENYNPEKIEYEMDLDKITFGKHKFSDGFKECIIIRI